MLGRSEVEKTIECGEKLLCHEINFDFQEAEDCLKVFLFLSRAWLEAGGKMPEKKETNIYTGSITDEDRNIYNRGWNAASDACQLAFAGYVSPVTEGSVIDKKMVIPRIEDKVSKLYDLVKIQVKCSRQDLSDQYMRGMANGLICALAVFKEWKPIYIEKRTELEITHANQLRAIKFCPSKKKHGEVICPKCMPIFKALSRG